MVLLISQKTSAAELGDGEYTISYSVLKADSDSASMADGYFNKPAKLLIKNGSLAVQMGLNTSEITEFKVNGSNVQVINDNGNSKTVQFPINTLNSPTTGEIHVVVPGYDYDHWYTIRFNFDTNTIKSLANDTSSSTDKSETSTVKSTSENNGTSTESMVTTSKVENPQTADLSNNTIYSVLMLSSIVVLVSIFIIRKKQKESN